jgi:hypothetical protein
MADETQAKVLLVLDALAVEVAAGRNDTAELRHEVRRDIGALSGGLGALTNEVRTGFDRVDRRLGNLETRVEDVQGGLKTLTRRVEGVEGGLHVLTTRIEGVEGGLHVLATRVEGVQTELRSFRGGSSSAL